MSAPGGDPRTPEVGASPLQPLLTRRLAATSADLWLRRPFFRCPFGVTSQGFDVCSGERPPDPRGRGFAPTTPFGSSPGGDIGGLVVAPAFLLIFMENWGSAAHPLLVWQVLLAAWPFWSYCLLRPVPAQLGQLRTALFYGVLPSPGWSGVRPCRSSGPGVGRREYRRRNSAQVHRRRWGRPVSMV